MRRADKQITDRDGIDAVIRAAEVCRLAFAVANEPYIVPVSFGYDGHSLYFHTAETGRKIDCIAANNRVCFEMERDVRLVGHPEKACKWTFDYESVVGLGTVEELASAEGRAAGLNHIMRHYSGQDWDLPPAAVTGTRVWRIVIDSVSGKRSGGKAD